MTSFTGIGGRRIVEPGNVDLILAGSSADLRTRLPFQLVGAEREVDHTRRLVTDVTVVPVEADGAFHV